VGGGGEGAKREGGVAVLSGPGLIRQGGRFLLSHNVACMWVWVWVGRDCAVVKALKPLLSAFRPPLNKPSAPW
jgi:hypothetical protein